MSAQERLVVDLPQHGGKRLFSLYHCKPCGFLALRWQTLDGHLRTKGHKDRASLAPALAPKAHS
jgi:hypothetical protein